MKTCALCGRELGTNEDNINKHHLVPKEYGGKITVVLHRICHRKIHSIFSNKELAKRYHTIDNLLSHPLIQAFVKWVKSKPIDFYAPTKDMKKKVQNLY